MNNNYETVWLVYYLVFDIVFLVGAIITVWKIFQKAGRPGWGCLIPFYNTYLLLSIINRPWWWILLMFIPLINVVISILIALDLAKAFGKSSLFGILGLWLFSFVGYPILAFGKAQYIGMNTKATPIPQQMPPSIPTANQQPTTPLQ